MDESKSSARPVVEDAFNDAMAAECRFRVSGESALRPDESELREHAVVKFIVAAPEHDGIAMMGRVQRRLHPRLDVRLDADFDIPHGAGAEAPPVVFTAALDALEAGGRCLVFAIVADEQGDDHLTAIHYGVKDQVAFRALLWNQSADGRHVPSSLVVTESRAGLGIAGEVRLVDSDDAMCKALFANRDPR